MKSEVGEAETQKLRNGVLELRTQELRNGLFGRSRVLSFLHGFPEFLSSKLPNSVSESLSFTSGVGEAETQKLRKEVEELGTQELRNGLSGRSRVLSFLSGLPEFLSSKLLNSVSEFMSFGLALFGFRLSAFGFPALPALLLSFLALSASGLAAEPPDAQQRGRVLAEEILAGRPADALAGRPNGDSVVAAQPTDILAGPRAGESASQTVSGQIRRKSGERISLSLTVRLTSTLTNWLTIYEVTNGPTGDVRLEILQTPKSTNQYRLTQAPAGGLASAKARIISGDETMTPFAGSDFWIADLGLEFLHWPDQRVIAEEKRRSRDCQVLESRPPVLKSGSYGRVLTYVDIESGGIILVEAYGANSRLLKAFAPKAPKKVNDQWELQKMSIRNEQTGSQTILDFAPPEKR